MSSYGAHVTNSGPLELRTYLTASPNETYLLQAAPRPDAELPVSSNRLLITSSNGLLAPSEQFYVSSVTLSTLTASTASVSTLTDSLLQTSTLAASTTTLTTIQFSSITGSSIQGTSFFLTSSLRVPTLSTSNLNASTIIGGPGSGFSTSTLYVTNQLTALTSTVSFSTVTFVNMSGTNTVRAAPISTTTLITNFISSTYLSTNTFAAGSLVTNSASTTNLTYQNSIGSTLSLNAATVTNTLAGSTIYTTNLSFVNLVINVLSSASLSGSTISAPTVTGVPFTYSTLASSTLITTQSYTSLGTYSTLTGSTLTTSTVSLSVLNVSSLYGSTLSVSSISGNTIVTSGSNASTVTGSTLTTNVITLLQGTTSTLTGSTMLTLSLSTSLVSFSSMTTSTSLLSTLIVSSMSFSTLLISTLFAPIVNHSTLRVSTLLISSQTASSLNVCTVSLSSLAISTAVLTSITISTINSVNIGAPNASGNTTAGYTSFPNNTGNNNTAFGYTTLNMNTSSGTFNAALGSRALVSNTTGTTNTVIGTSTSITTGTYNTYLGYGATPSGPTVFNEIVIGGTSNGTPNMGLGTNTIVVGNPQTATTRMYGAVGIGTNAPVSALDVRGGYTQTGGNMTIYNNTVSSAVTLFIYSDGTPGMGMFLNDSIRAVDGGPNCATVRNDYGMLRLQAKNGANGIVISTTTVGIGTASMSFSLESFYGIRCTVDGSIDSVAGATNAVVAYSPTKASNASIWMGFDPTNDCGYINAGIGTNGVRPICIQARGGAAGGGAVGIGKTNPAYGLDVTGSTRYTGNLQVDGNLSCASLASSATGSQWSGLPGNPISYSGNVSISGALSANVYANLPVASASVTGLASVGTGLGLSSTTTYLSIPFLCCTLNGTAGDGSSLGSGNYVVKYSVIYSNNIAVTSNAYVNVNVSGWYNIVLSGTEGGTIGQDTIIVWISGNSIGSTVTPGYGSYYNPVSLSILRYFNVDEGIFITSKKTPFTSTVYFTMYFVSV